MGQADLPFLDFLNPEVDLGDEKRPAIWDDKTEKSITYQILRAQVGWLAGLFNSAAHTRSPRGLILCAAPRTAMGAIAYLGAAASGQAVLMLDPDSLRPAGFHAFIEAYEPQWVVLRSPLRPQGPYLPVAWPSSDLFLWRRAQGPVQALHPSLFLLLPRPSSSLGSAQTVRLSYEAMTHNVLASLQAMNYPQEAPKDPCALLVMPLAYAFGLSVFHMMLTIKAAVLLSERAIQDKALWELARARRITLFAGVPFQYEYLSRAGLENLHVPLLKCFLQAGGCIPTLRMQEILQQVTAREGALYSLYGLTETAPRLTSLALHKHPDKIQSIGQLLQGGQAHFTPEGLHYQGPNVMMGYAQTRHDLAQEDTQKGQYFIPEPGWQDDDGFLYFKSQRMAAP